MIFKVEAEGDAVYIEADDRTQARAQLDEKMGPIPESLLTWTDNVELPNGEYVL